MAKSKTEEVLQKLHEQMRDGYSYHIDESTGALRVEIHSDIPDGVDLSGVDYLVFTDTSKVGKGVKLPERILIHGFDTHGVSKPRGVDISTEEWNHVTTLNPSHFTIFPSGDLAKTGVKEVLVDGTHVYFPADIKMPKDAQLTFITKSMTYDKKQWNLEFDDQGYGIVKKMDLPICGHIPDGLDLSNLAGITITQLGSLGKGIKFPKEVTILTRHIPSKIDFSGIENLNVYSINVPSGTDLSKVKSLTVNGQLHLDKDVKLPKNITLGENSSDPGIGGYIPDGTDLSNVKLDPESLKKITYLGKGVKFDLLFSEKYAREIAKLRLKGAGDRVSGAVKKFKQNVSTQGLGPAIKSLLSKGGKR